MVMINDSNGWEKCSKFSFWENLVETKRGTHEILFLLVTQGPENKDEEKLEF